MDDIRKESMTRDRLCKIFVTMLLLQTTIGCGQKTETGTITGKVSFQDEPIASGMIAFIGQNGKVASGNIANGAYTVSDVEVGPKATVTVKSHPPSPMMQPPTGQMEGRPTYPPGKFVRIPSRYGDSKRSGLTFEVVDGTQTADFDLQP